MSQNLIVIPDDFPPVYSGRPELAELHALGELRLYSSRAGSRAALLERLHGARAIINVRSYTVLDAEMLAALPDLRHIAVFGAGTDNIDVAAAARLGISVSNAPGVNARSVAEHALALTLAVARALPRHERELRAGRWTHFDGVELAGKAFGVIGLGAIGRHTARIAAAFGMRVLAWSPRHDEERARAAGATLLTFDEVLSAAEVVSLHVAVSDRTRGLIGVEQLALMKPGSILINTARGALVDEAALLTALTSGRLRGAGLDVYAEEPLPPGHPLTTLENVVLTPHCGWMTHEARDRLVRVPIDNIAAFFNDVPQNLVSPP